GSGTSPSTKLPLRKIAARMEVPSLGFGGGLPRLWFRMAQSRRENQRLLRCYQAQIFGRGS
ncbi:MAG: hypothetical protein ACK5TQ_14070, partial [Acetobacteraceae bacterium]